MKQFGLKSLAAIIACTGLLTSAVGIAYADDISNTIDGTIDSTLESISLVAGGSNGAVGFMLQPRNGDGDTGCNFEGTTEALVVKVISSNPAVATVTPSTLTFANCGDTPSVAIAPGVTGSATVSLEALSNDSGGTFNLVPASFTVNVDPAVVVNDQDEDGVTDDDDNCPTVANADQANADNDGLGNLCDANSYAPALAAAADDATGNEGSTLSTTGGFSDGDGNGTLTITKVSGAGDVTDNGDGTWSWSLAVTDNGSGTVVVTAEDGEHANATDSFDWSAANVAPSVGTVTVNSTGACSVSIRAAFTDPGSDDTHRSVIDWGDGSQNGPVAATSPVTGSHTFTSAGTNTIMVSVTDNDGGVGSASGNFATKNTPSAILQPINSSGNRSSFKLGSSIPVKITVTDCGGALVDGLTPQVSLAKVDSTPDAEVNELASTSTPTTGTSMRWDATAAQYIYNLSTKNSQFNGQPLTAGTYRVTVSDPSFASSVSASFDVKK